MTINQSPDGSGIQTFTAVDLRAAMNEVRKTLGADALILDHKQVGDRVLLRACLEQDLLASEETVSETQIQSPIDRDIVIEESQSHSVQAGDLTYVSADALKRGGAYRFVGHSGVGKTTLMIKVMVEWVLHRGNKNITLVSQDTSKLAGQEALQLACRMMNVELLTDVKGGDTYYTAPGELLLIDTAGADACPPLSSGSVQDIYVWSTLYRSELFAGQKLQRFAGVALTHLDVAAPEEKLLSELSVAALPIFWMSDSSDVAAGVKTGEATALDGVLAKPKTETVNNLTDEKPSMAKSHVFQLV